METNDSTGVAPARSPELSPAATTGPKSCINRKAGTAQIHYRITILAKSKWPCRTRTSHWRGMCPCPVPLPTPTSLQPLRFSFVQFSTPKFCKTRRKKLCRTPDMHLMDTGPLKAEQLTLVCARICISLVQKTERLNSPQPPISRSLGSNLIPLC